MDLYEAIAKRRTVRKFKGPATEAQLMRIMVAGTKAPSGMNQQRWEFIVVDDPALIEQIADWIATNILGMATDDAEISDVAALSRIARIV